MFAFNRKNILSFLFPALAISFYFFAFADVFYSKAEVSKTPVVETTTAKSESINAVYVTGWSAGNNSYLNYLSELFETTEINAVVVDIKDSSGYVFYNASVNQVQKYKLYNYSIKDIDKLVKFFHDKGIYTIARIAVFEDPMLAQNRPDLAIYSTEKTASVFENILWQDYKGLSWMDPASQEVWDYNINLAKDALLHGFDEINFDYVRFPSDGNASTMGFPIWNKKTLKSEVVKSFFAYTRSQMPSAVLSVDLFGLTTVNKDDLGIGQNLENALLYFDYVCPMVYPSHYASGFLGFENPAEYPYWVVKYSMLSANIKRQTLVEGGTDSAKLAKLRPWLQDFDLGADYTVNMVKSEITAVGESLADNYNGYMLWNPSNYYTQEAIAK